MENSTGTQEYNISRSHTPPKGKNPLGCMLSRIIGCLHILFLDMVATIVFASANTQCTPYLLRVPKFR
jgi:hypothetical protein